MWFSINFFIFIFFGVFIEDMCEWLKIVFKMVLKCFRSSSSSSSLSFSSSSSSFSLLSLIFGLCSLLSLFSGLSLYSLLFLCLCFRDRCCK